VRYGKRRLSKIVLSLIITLAIISISSPSYAVTYEVYTYGGGDFLYYILNGVAMIFSGNIVGSLIVIAGMLLTIMLVSRLFYDSHGSYSTYSGEGAYNIIKVALLTLMALEVLSIPKADVLIQDRSKPSQTNVVANVPFIQAFAMHASSMIGDRIGEVMEDVFTLPDVIKYRNHGVGLGVKYTNEFMGIYPPDTTYLTYAGQYRVHLLYTVLREFFMTCLFSEFSSPNKDNMTSTAFNAIFTSPNMINDPSIEALSDTYNKVITGLKINEPTMTCHDALPNIRAAWNDVYSLWVDDLMKKISGRTGAEIGESIGAEAYIEQIINYYSPAMLTPKDMIINIAAVNTLKDAMLVFSARTQNGSSLAEYLSKRKTTAGWMTAARMLNSIIIILRQIFEALVYGLCIFLPLAFVIGGPQAFSTYIKLVFWLNLWVPFYVLLNLLADIRFADAMQNLTELASGGFGFNFRNIEEVQEQANIVIGIIGAAAWTVPTFAWGLISGGGYAVSSVMQSMSSKSSAHQTSYQAGAEVAGAGNVSTANRSAGNESYRSSDAITSSGSLHSGWVNSLSMQGALKEIGLDNAVSGNRNNQLYSYGSGSGLKDKAYSSGLTKGELTGGGLAGAKEVAGGYFNDDVWAMSLAESVQQHTAKGEQYNKIGESLGFKDSKDAAAIAGVLQGDQGFANLMSFYKTKGAVGLKGLIDAGAGKETIQASQTLSALSSMAHHSMTPADFGGARGMVETAKTIGNVEAFQSQFQQAKDQGFAGDEADFMKTRAKADYAKGFASGQKMQQFADKNYGGNMQNMFKAETGWQYGRVMGAVSKAQQHGWNPETLREYMGAMESVSAMGKAGAYKLLGDEGYRQTEQGRVLNEGAKFEMLKMAASKAGFAGNDGAVSGQEMSNFLQAHQGNVGVVLNSAQAASVGHAQGGGQFMLSMNPKTGGILMSRAERGSLDKSYNLSTTEAGSKDMQYSVSNAVISRGTMIDSGTAFQMALKGDQSIVRPVTNQFLNDNQQSAEIAALSSALGGAASTFMQRQGVSADFARGEGHLSMGAGGGLIFKAEGGVRGSVGGERTDRKVTDLMVQQYDSLIRSTLEEASSTGLSTEGTRSLLSSRIEDYTNAFYKEVQSRNPESFGVTSPGNALTELGQKAIDSIGIVPSPYNTDNKK
jgi:hypothetical protein